ncbi:M81 family metallopeptidase [Minwuia thermotolerans]|uniref:Microcystinase C n=1 Tax=Minwuia thermotolerans TaxID=2056226 RepID=A0A2M9G1A3_9PROT|nr:M81 family metallopeptidase [Minwuia thermotolerans]PJK29492.1 microcystin degradation protein MlrC [Minwuia thermotolerans]
MARIAHAGFMHETNTFAPILTTYEHFEKGEGWPPLTLGEDMLKVFPPINIGTGGFINEAQNLGHELAPVCWSAAVPAGYVTEDAYERITALMLEGLEQAVHDGADAIYLDLHGAMVTEHLEDGEGELLARLRSRIGGDIPVVVSLDLHVNITRQMVDLADALIAYRTYPHVDMAETGRRAARHLDELLRGRPSQARAFVKLDFLPPLTGQCTMVEPSKSVYELVARLEGGAVSSTSYTPGFHPADIRECGPAVVAYADDQESADRAAQEIADFVLANEAGFAEPMLAPRAAVAEALRLSNRATKTVVLCDAQDNSGAGGTSDTTGLLRALVEGGAQGAVIGHLTDPAAARAAHEAGVGARLTLALGGKLFTEGDPPFEAEFEVTGLSEGRFLCTGPFYGGTNANLGKTAVLTTAGVSVVVCENRMQAADKEMFRHIGIEPADVPILGLKSAVHFRGDFTDIAETILVVEAPGAFVDNPARNAYRNLRPGVRLGPHGAPFGG